MSQSTGLVGFVSDGFVEEVGGGKGAGGKGYGIWKEGKGDKPRIMPGFVMLKRVFFFVDMLGGMIPSFASMA